MALAKNLASGTLAESISASTTTLLVYVGEGSASTIKGVWPNTPFYASIMPATPSAGVPNSLDSEIVKVTAVSNDQVGNTALTVIRAQRGTTGKAFTEGAIVTNADYADDAVLLSEEGTSETETPWIETEDITDGAVTGDKIDFSTFPHIVACGTISYRALNAQGSASMSIVIPTQPDTNYYISLGNDNSNSYWTKLFFKIGDKTTTGFKIYVYNDGTTGQNAGAGVVNYIVAR